MAKEIDGKLKLQVPAGQANPAPPVGPALGQRGLNIMDFCKVFNDKSKGEQPGVMLPVVVTYYTDKSFTLEIKLPPVTFLIKEALKIKKGSKEPGRDIIKTISQSQCKEIAEKKLNDLNIKSNFINGLRVSNDKIINISDRNRVKSYDAIKFVSDKLELKQPKIIEYDSNKISNNLKSFYEVNRTVKCKIIEEKLKYKFKHQDYKKALLKLTKQLITSNK